MKTSKEEKRFPPRDTQFYYLNGGGGEKGTGKSRARYKQVIYRNEIRDSWRISRESAETRREFSSALQCFQVELTAAA